MALGENAENNQSQYFSLTQEQRSKLAELRVTGRREEARELRQQLRDESRRARLSERAKNDSIETNLRESNNRAASEKRSEIRASDNENIKNQTKVDSFTIFGPTTTTNIGTPPTNFSSQTESSASTLPSFLLHVCRNGNPALYQFYGGYVRDL